MGGSLAGEKVAAFPLPEALLRVETFAGLPAEKLAWLHGVARAARQGQLDVGRLATMNPDAAMADLKSLRGIGPFYSALIVVRACGRADVLPTQEPKALELAAQLYGLLGLWHPKAKPGYRPQKSGLGSKT